MSTAVLTNVSDLELVARLEAVCAESNRLLARLIELLIEVDERRLHLKIACSSLFDFCVRRLGMSEGAAFRRITAARLVRRFPTVLARLEQGDVHLSVLVLLRDHLTEANVDELLGAASRRSKREVEELLARRAPRADVPGTIRKLPAARLRPRGALEEGAERCATAMPAGMSVVDGVAGGTGAVAGDAKGVVDGMARSGAGAGDAKGVVDGVAGEARAADALGGSNSSREGGTAGVESPSPSRVPLRPRGRIEPLSDARHRLQLTISTAARQKLERARDLMRHRNPSGDLEAIVELALDALLEKLEKERLGKTTQTGRSPRVAKAKDVTCETRRTVFERDGEQCTFEDAKGRRCPSRALLELDHVEARALGGSHEASNLRVRCRAHNQLHAENVFGRELVRVRMHFRQRKRAGGAAHLATRDRSDGGEGADGADGAVDQLSPAKV